MYVIKKSEKTLPFSHKRDKVYLIDCFSTHLGVWIRHFEMFTQYSGTMIISVLVWFCYWNNSFFFCFFISWNFLRSNYFQKNISEIDWTKHFLKYIYTGNQCFKIFSIFALFYSVLFLFSLNGSIDLVSTFWILYIWHIHWVYAIGSNANFIDECMRMNVQAYAI